MKKDVQFLQLLWRGGFKSGVILHLLHFQYFQVDICHCCVNLCIPRVEEVVERPPGFVGLKFYKTDEMVKKQ